MTQFVIFDLNGMVAWFDSAPNKETAMNALRQEDDSYQAADTDRVHELDDDEAAMLKTWIDAGQKSHEWPFDWRSR